MAGDLTEQDLEFLDPHPDIHALFCHYNDLYFDSQLGACSVEWSSARMTLCGGVCEFQKGGGCRIKLSEPLLKLRPSRDLKEVLLHEMIHACMMLGGIRDDEPSGHGTIFRSIMRRINESTAPDTQRPAGGYNINTHHTMHAEVDFYRQHHWRCARCGNLVKRAMNRPPQEADCRGRMGRGEECADPHCNYHMHIRHCGGTYEKVKEPDGFLEKKRKGAKAAPDASSDMDARGTTNSGGRAPPAKRPRKGPAGTQDISKFFGGGRRLGGGVREAGAGSRGTDEAAGACGKGAEGPKTNAPNTCAEEGQEVLQSLAAVASRAQAEAASQQQRRRQQQQHQHEQELQQKDQQQYQQAQQQHRPQPPRQPIKQPEQISARMEAGAAERRQLLAEAALRRLQAQAFMDSLAPQQQQRHQLVMDLPLRDGQDDLMAQPLQCPVLLSPTQQDLQQPQQEQEAQGDLEGHSLPKVQREHLQRAWQQEAQQQQQQHLSVAEDVLDLTSSQPEPQSPTRPSVHIEGCTVDGLKCPICGRCWPAAELSNSALNAHIDACLAQGS
ncbi:hypothetical protein N2152v2_006433 [Parachlorella kessleri]